MPKGTASQPADTVGWFQIATPADMVEAMDVLADNGFDAWAQVYDEGGVKTFRLRITRTSSGPEDQVYAMIGDWLVYDGNSLRKLTDAEWDASGYTVLTGTPV